ncbi:MAG TPA: amino acid adenylation domain-containing protein [Cellvibrionaceae bacterium]
MTVARTTHNPFSFGELEAAVATTESQREVWLAALYGDDANCGFNESINIHLVGAINYTALEAALQDLVRRHQSLRGCFSGDGKQMVFYQERTVPLVRHDLRGQSAEDAVQRFNLLREAVVTKPFDLYQGPLARFDLVVHSNTEHRLVLSFHHAICDGWSLYVLAEELGILYSKHCGCAVEELPQAPCFADYALWERAGEFQALHRSSVDYWLKRFAAGVPNLELPYDNARPAQRTFAAKRWDTDLPMGLVGQLKKLAASNKSTLMSTLMAGFVVYLNRWSGATQIVLGVPFAGQMAKGDGGLVGHCVNIIPLYFELTGQESFGQVITLCQNAMLEAFDNQYLTYGTLLQHLDTARDPSKPPLVSVIFNLDQQGPPSEAYEGLTCAFGSNPRLFENFDLNINITLAADHAEIEATYNLSLWRLPTMQRRMQEYVALYAQLVANPSLKLPDIELILPADLRAIRASWQQDIRPYPLKQVSLHGLIEAAVDRYPDHTALVVGDQRLTYKQMDEMANRLAHFLIQQGVGAEQLVPIMLDRSFEMVIAINAVLKAGAAYLPLDPEHPADRIEYIVHEARARWVLTKAAYVAQLPADVQCLTMEDAPERIAQLPLTRPGLTIAPEQLAYVIYTSGSTGKPKGVMNEHQAVCNHMLWMQQQFALTTADKILQKTPYTFDVSLWELFLPLMCGAQLVMAKPGGHKEAGYLVELIQQEGITHTHFVTSMGYLFLQEADQARCPSLKRVLSSGEAVTKDFEQRFTQAFPDVELWNLYGPTEAAIHITYWQCGLGDAGSTVPIGRALPNNRLYVVNEQGKLQPPGVPGELLLAGVQVARGYLNRADLTQERFISDPFLSSGERVYRTGDLVRLRDDGVVEYLGRNDFQVKVRGQRIELGEIEAVLSQFPGITQTVVLAREDRVNDQRLVAYMLCKSQPLPESATLREHLRLHVPDYMVPQHFVFLDSYPLTSSGKVDRKALPPPVTETLSADAVEKPANLIEEQLLSIWQEVLGLTTVSVTSDFFELGGHSLLGTQMFARVKHLFGVNLGLRRLFEAPTIRSLAAVILAETQAGNVQSKIVPRAPGEQLIASTQQQRVWYLEQIEPESLAYNLPAAFRLNGRLNVEALQQAFDTIEKRHELLRAGFSTQGGKLVVTLLPSLNLDLTPVTLAQLGVADYTALRAHLRERAATPFNTATGPLFTAHLVQVAPDDHVIFLLIHHLVFDGWSFDIFLKEVCTLYNAYAQSLPNPLPELPVQYADYALWQRQWLASDAVQKQLNYWLKQLGGTLPVLDLPLDKPRPAQQAHRAEGVNFHLDEGLLEQLEELGQKQGATLFMVMLGLYALMLYRYSRQLDILVSVPVSARNQLEIAQLMGPFINRLVCRFALKPQRSFASWLHEVKKTLLEALDNQDTQFETLVHALNPPRDPARPPLVQTLFSFQDVRNRADQMDGLVRSQIDIERMGVQTDLDVWLKRQIKGMDGGMEFPSELFNVTTVQAFADSLIESARFLVNKPDSTIAELASALPSERTRLSDLSGAPASVPFVSVLSLLASAKERSGQEPAVIASDGTYNLPELEVRSNELAWSLKAQGIGPGALVGLVLKRGYDLPALVIALWKIGAAYMPLDPLLPKARVETMLELAQVTALVGHQRWAEDFGVHRYISLETLEQVSFEPYPIAQLSETSRAYVIFTSGSTGVPKGVEVGHGALSNFLRSMKDLIALKPGNRLLAITTLSFDISILELFLPLVSGGSVRVADEALVVDGFALKQQLEQAAITHLQATPTTWRMLLTAGWRAPQGFTALCGGEALAGDLAASLLQNGVDLWNLYGPTEATVWTAAYHVNDAEQVKSQGAAPVYLGQPIANTQLYIYDEKLQPLPVGVFGDLWIGGAGLAQGYIGAPQLTSERFITDAQGHRLYKSGDLARWTQSGQLEYQGRSDLQIKLRGFRIELAEIEAQLRTHPAVEDAAVVVREAGSDQRLVACVIYCNGEEPTASELRSHLRKVLPDYMLPQQFTAMEQFPVTVSGKLDRKKLSAPEAATQATGQAFTAPSTATEKIVARIWGEALLKEQVSVDSQFFDIGGHSLLALEVILAIEEACNVRFAPQDMWVNTLEQLAAKIDAKRGIEQTQKTAEPIFAQLEADQEKRSGWLGRLFGRD